MFKETIPCSVGYVLTAAHGGFAFQPPRTVFSTRTRPLGSRSIQNCPAVNGIERQIVEIPSPIGLRLSLIEGAEGPEIAVQPSGTFAEGEKIAEMLSVEAAERWRHPRRPIIRLTLPFCLVTDEPCMVSVLPPFLGPGLRRWPGVMIAGRYPLWLWPQNAEWIFEWDRPAEELLIKQGEPLLYLLFEFNAPEKRPKLVEAEMTPALDDYRRGMDGVEHFTTDLESVWEMARARRPERLLSPMAPALPEGADG